MNEENKICKYCKHYNHWWGSCSNYLSEHCADLIPFDKTCDEWEGWEDVDGNANC
jgi:hypothetical protein